MSGADANIDFLRNVSPAGSGGIQDPWPRQISSGAPSRNISQMVRQVSEFNWPDGGFSRLVSGDSEAGGKNFRLPVGFDRMVSGESLFGRQVSQQEIDFHREKTKIAKTVLDQLVTDEQKAAYDREDGSDGLAPPSADVPENHFKRRQLVNEVLAATEDYFVAQVGELDGGGVGGRTQSCFALGYIAEESRTSVVVEKAVDNAVSASDRSKLMSAAAFGFDRQLSEGLRRRLSTLSVGTPGLVMRRTMSSMSSSGLAPASPAAKNQNDAADLKRRASMAHHEMKRLVSTDGLTGGALLTPLAHEKPVLKDPVGIRCVEHLHDPKWTKLARAIRDSIYDPDFYDDGTYGPMYVRLAVHGAATYDRHDNTGGLEGGAMRYKPEYSDAHNKFCKPIVKRQHELYKVPFPWASYADIQCLCSYVALECANGPIIPFTPGRRDVIPQKDMPDWVDKVDDENFLLLNYRERGDTGCEDEPVPKCPASGEPGDCPFLTKMRVMPGRVPGPEQGHLGKPCAPVTKEAEQKEMEEVAHHIREIFVDRIGATDRATVALIAGGHSLGRCHPEISGYAGPWQSNPGYFNNVYCKKLLSEDWHIVDRNMEDCSGDLITGLKPYGMRRQYVNKGGKGDLMMLVSDMALREDSRFGKYIREYARDNDKLKADFGAAFKWITELGFEPPAEKRGLEKVRFKLRKWRADVFRWIGDHLCNGGDGDADANGGAGAAASDAPPVGEPYTMEEVKTHASKTDCWVVINKKVCNLTQFMNTHPGGQAVIADVAGTDASRDWNAIHNRNAIEAIAPHVVIGHLVAKKEGGAAGSDSFKGA